MQRWVKRWVPVAAIAGFLLAGGGAAFASSAAPASGRSTTSTSSTPAETAQPRGYGLGQAGAGQRVMAMRGAGLQSAPGGVMGEVLQVLNINPEAFIQDRQSGMSFADIAKKQGVPEQKVIDAMKTQLTERMNLSMQNGQITAEQAQQIQTRLETQLKTRIEQSGVTGGMRGINAGWWAEGVNS